MPFNSIQSAYAMFHRHKLGIDEASIFEHKPKPKGRKRDATVTGAYATGYRQGLAGGGGMSHATYKQQEKIDAYLQGVRDGRKDRDNRE